jgi:hypothetical protein
VNGKRATGAGIPALTMKPRPARGFFFPVTIGAYGTLYITRAAPANRRSPLPAGPARA